MDNILSIQWSTGHMAIYMPAFFPCTAGKLNKLKKYIAMDAEHAEALLKLMQAFFQERIPECEEVFQREGKAYWNYQDKAADYEHQLADGKTPVGLPLTKEQKNDWKKYAKKIVLLLPGLVSVVHCRQRNRKSGLKPTWKEVQKSE